MKLKDTYPLYLNNKAVQPNTDLAVTDKFTGEVAFRTALATPDVIEAAMAAARKHGTIISYDLNYRPCLWQAVGGKARAQQVNRRLAAMVDVMIGNEEDFTACLGVEVPDTGEAFDELDAANFRRMIDTATKQFPNFQVVATTLRTVRTATLNDWGAVAWSGSTGFVEATLRRGVEIFDRVGGGDSFASGLIYGLLQGYDLTLAVEYGAAHGALAMTTPGDTSMASLKEVESLVNGGGARVQR